MWPDSTQVRIQATLSSGENIGLACSGISHIAGVPAAFFGGWMMLRPLYCCCYDSRFSGCTVLLVCFWVSRVTVAHLFFSLLLNMSHAKSTSKFDNSKSPPPLTFYYTNVRGLRGNFTDLKGFMLKNNPDIFALYETNLHGDIHDSDSQLPGYLPIHRKYAGHMYCLGVYVKSNLPIAQENIIEDEDESCVFVWLFYTLLP